MTTNTLIVYLHSGKTLVFHSVSELYNFNSGISFTYFGQSTKTKNKAHLFNVAGYSHKDTRPKTSDVGEDE